MNNSNIYSSKLIIVLTIIITNIILMIINKATYVEITELLIVIVPSYFALNEAGKIIREKNKKQKRKKDKLLSRKFIITMFLILFSSFAVSINMAVYDQMSSFIKILIPIYFASNEIEKFTSFGETKNES